MKQRTLIVDDDPGTRRLLANLLVREYAVREARTGEEALQIAAAWHPDLVFLDLILRGIDGQETCRRIKALPAQPPPQVIVVSASSLADDLRLAFAAGADDYFVKPFRSCELLGRTHLHMRLTHALRAESTAADAHVPQSAGQHGDSSHEVHAIQDMAVVALTKLAEARDCQARGHLFRLRDYATRLAQEARLTQQYRFLITDEFLADVRRSAPLHDIGKVGIPDTILLKPGRLTALEFDVMKQHTVIGAGILEQTARQGNAGAFLRMAAQIARSHHERWDGSGYPAGLVGEQIPLAARIVAVADVFDALTTTRPYKPPWSTERACAYIVERAGTHFDPEIARCLGSCFPEIDRIHQQYAPNCEPATRQASPTLSVVAASH